MTDPIEDRLDYKDWAEDQVYGNSVNDVMIEIEASIASSYKEARVKIAHIDSENCQDLDNPILYLANYTFNTIPRRLLYSFAYHRIKEKKTDGTHPELSLDRIATLRQDRDFMNTFITFLENWQYMVFLTQIENDIINASRGSENKCTVNLNNSIRQGNRDFIKRTDQQALYHEIERQLARV